MDEPRRFVLVTPSIGSCGEAEYERLVRPLEWKLAVENQTTDRAFRIGQRRNVLMHKFMTTGTVEARIAEMIAQKRKLADDILAGDAEVNLTELSDEALMDLVRLDVTRAAR